MTGYSHFNGSFVAGSLVGDAPTSADLCLVAGSLRGHKIQYALTHESTNVYHVNQYAHVRVT